MPDMPTKTAVLVAAVGILVLIVVGGATRGNDPQLVHDVAGAPGYTWNQPFLAWPQTGDLPCITEDGPCGPPAPTLEPGLKAQGRPLTIAQLDVPVGTPGRHELELGQLILPNGIHTRTFFRITNGDPAVYRVAQTHVEFRSLEPGASPFREFARDRPPFDGPERVVAILVWDVDWSASGAIMTIADVVVE
jgi:hypothetical protein